MTNSTRLQSADIHVLQNHKFKILVSARANLILYCSTLGRKYLTLSVTNILLLNFVLEDLIEKAERQPNITIGVLVSIVVVIFTALIKLLFGREKPEFINFSIVV